MKTLNELYTEIMADEGLRGEYISAAEKGSVEEFLKAHGCEATERELNEFLGGLEKHGELSDDELDDVAAGKKCGTLYMGGYPIVTALNVCRRFRCRFCDRVFVSDKMGKWSCPGCHRTAQCDCCHSSCYNKGFLVCYNPERHNN